MALRQRRRPGRPFDRWVLPLALAVLLVAVAGTALWIVVSLHQPPEPSDTDPDSASSAPVDPDWTPACFLTVISDENRLCACLIRSDPANGTLRVAPLSPQMTLEKENTLEKLYRSQGAAAVAAALSDQLSIDNPHYFTLTFSEAEKWFNYLESGLEYTLEEPVEYTDADGLSLRLTAGAHNLTALQAVGLLRYTGWSSPARADETAAALACQMLNQYFVADRRLESDFSALSNLCRTDLRIGDFTAARPRMTHLAAQNTGALCRMVSIEELCR